MLAVVRITCSLLAIAATAHLAVADEPKPDASVARALSPRSESIGMSYRTAFNGALVASDLLVRAAAPIARGDGYGVALLASYESTKLGLDDADDPTRLRRFGVMLGGGMGLAPGRSLRGSIGVAHASDLRDPDLGALQVTVSSMVHLVLGPSDAIQLGGVYASSADLLIPVLPLIGYVHHRTGARFRFDMLLPAHVRAEYRLTEKLEGALALEVLGTKWQVQGMTPGTHETAKRTGGSVFAELAYALVGPLRLQIRAGMLVASYDLPQLAMAFDDSLRIAGYAQLGLVVTP